MTWCDEEVGYKVDLLVSCCDRESRVRTSTISVVRYVGILIIGRENAACERLVMLGNDLDWLRLVFM